MQPCRCVPDLSHWWIRQKLGRKLVNLSRICNPVWICVPDLSPSLKSAPSRSQQLRLAPPAPRSSSPTPGRLCLPAEPRNPELNPDHQTTELATLRAATIARAKHTSTEREWCTRAQPPPHQSALTARCSDSLPPSWAPRSCAADH